MIGSSSGDYKKNIDLMYSGRYKHSTEDDDGVYAFGDGGPMAS
jgi:hypothetical protein